jgi:hypothetical protein
MVNYLRKNEVPARNIVTIVNPVDECEHDRRVDIMLVEMREVMLPEPTPVVEPT